MSTSIVEWIDTAALERQSWVHSRTFLARKWAEKSADEITTIVSYMTPEEHVAFVGELLSTLGIKLSGTGIELGAGAAVLSNTLATLFPAINKIYALELVPDMARLLQPRVIKACRNDGRVVPVIGSFDDLKLPDNSLDFAVEFDSFHHSDDMARTIAEAARVLKPGGLLICFDRARPDSLSEAQREFMLSWPYSRAFKEQYNMPLDRPFTRRENGEHEPRHREWVAALKRAGFETIRFTAFHRHCWEGLKTALLAQVPFSVRRALGRGAMVCEPAGILFYYLMPPLAKWGKFQYTPMRGKHRMGKLVITARKTRGTC